MKRTAYEILGVAPAASLDELRGAYRRLARDLHPDRAGDTPAANERFLELKAAYEILADPDTRAAYDRDPTGSLLDTRLDDERRHAQLLRRKQRLRRLYE